MLRTHIASHEIGLRFKRGDLVGVLPPGSYSRIRDMLPGASLVRISRLEERFSHRNLASFVEYDALEEHLLSLRISDSERALVWREGTLVDILGPGLHAFWKQSSPYVVERFDVTPERFEHDKLDVILGHASAPQHLRAVRAGRHEGVVFYRDGELISSMAAGVGAFWKMSSELTWAALDLREQVIEVAGQEIMTADRVSLRVSLVLTVQPTDFVAALTRVNDAKSVLYREAQLVLRAAVGARTLDKLLKDKSSLGEEVREPLAQRAESIGFTVVSVGLRDVILPGEMKTILNQVIEAEKRAEANLIRRREETAAARSQANTAKLLASQPALERMKELEALQEILKGSNATFVLGTEDVLGQVRRLTAAPRRE